MHAAHGTRCAVVWQLITESRPKELFTEFPIIHLVPVADRENPISGFYLCPVYKTLTRAGTLSTTGSRPLPFFVCRHEPLPRSLSGHRVIAIN